MHTTLQPSLLSGLKIAALALLAIVLGLMLGAWLARRHAPAAPGPARPAPGARFTAAEAFPNLTFESPVELTHAGDGSGRLFVVEQAGTIRVVGKDAAKADVFLDIAGRVRSGGEMGLLGLAFHPDFKQNGLFYVNYTAANPLRTVIAQFRAGNAGTGPADAATEKVLLTFRQPYSNHNGGKLAFGPDGFLYIATGDGGSGGDPQNNGQNKGTLLGKILRIDVDKPAAGQPYGIPADNPFVNEPAARPEIYAYGLRNPWRFSFDPATNRLWAGDVGQNRREEIDIIEKGGNYGWRIKEARDCFDPRKDCVEKNLVDPVLEYTHDKGDISVTGGCVYRGKALPALQGQYLYGDYASGRVWALAYGGPENVRNRPVLKLDGTLSAFGEDENREVYLCNHSGGKIMRLAEL